MVRWCIWKIKSNPPKKSVVKVLQIRPQQAKNSKCTVISKYRVRSRFSHKIRDRPWFLCRHYLSDKVLVLLVKLIFIWVGFDEMPLQEAFWSVFFLYKLYSKCFSTVRIHQQYAHFLIFCIFCNFFDENHQILENFHCWANNSFFAKVWKNTIYLWLLLPKSWRNH